MRILICYPWLSLGGAPNTAISLARGLKERGHEIFFFTKGGGIYESRLHEAGIPVISAPHHSYLPHLYHLNMKAYKILSDSLDRYSIEVVHAFHPYSYILSLFAAPKRNIPVVFTVVWLLYPKLFPSYPGRVIFVAEEFKDQASDIFGDYPREILVLPNRIDLDMFHPGIDHRDFIEGKGLRSSGLKIAFMSRIDNIKINSLRYAVEAVKILALRGRDVFLAIAGDGELFDELLDRGNSVNREVGREVIKMIGTIIETPQFLSWADIVLGIGRCAFEGMACGKPTLVVGENGLAGVVEPERAKELRYFNFAGRNIKEPVEPVLLADAIEGIMSNEHRYRHLCEFSRQYVMENYEYRAGAERLEKVYEAAISDPPLSRSERVRLFRTNLINGYVRRLYIAWRLKLRILIGRAGPGKSIRH